MVWMIGTILVTLAATAACLTLRPATALGVVMASAMLWPEYLRIPMGIAQMSAPRVAGLALLLRLLFTRGSAKVAWRWPDMLVMLFYLWLVAANILAGTPGTGLRTVIGSGFDTLLMYHLGRRVFANADQVGGAVKGIAIAAIILAPMALYENLTRSSPFIRALTDVMGAAVYVGGGSEVRLGMFRAFSTTQVPIYFGMAMMVLTGFMFAFRGTFRPKWLLWVGLAAAVSCVFSSISSGPWIGLMMAAGLNVFYWVRWLIVPSLCGMVAVTIGLEFLSNRHFYNLIDRIAMDSDNAYYRSRLMEVAMDHLSEYWLLGAAGGDLGFWGREIDYRETVDMVNNYLIVAVGGGVFALALYVSIKIGVMYSLIRAFKLGSPAMKPIAFSIASLLIALSFSEFSVGLYGPALLFTYIIMGYSVSMCAWAEEYSRKLRPAGAAKKGMGAGQPAVAGRGVMAWRVGDVAAA